MESQQNSFVLFSNIQIPILEKFIEKNYEKLKLPQPWVCTSFYLHIRQLLTSSKIFDTDEIEMQQNLIK